MKLILATNNAHKVREIKEILQPYFTEIITLQEAGIQHETVEDGMTFEENALKKAREIAEISGLPALADDSGLCVEALDGAPGVYSARYAAENDQNASDAENRRLLLKNMEEITNRRAYFVCAAVICWPDGKNISAEGRFYGEVAYEEKGENGFGYDSIFYVPQYGCTSAQMSREQKNSLSHRGIAFRELADKL